METVVISAKINKNKRNEFFQTIEALKNLVSRYCDAMEIKVKDNNKLTIRINFNGIDELEKNFSNLEFNILKGSVKSLCDYFRIKINGVIVES